jgi:sulfur carrier protein
MSFMNQITVLVNGKSFPCESNLLLPQLLAKLSFNPRLIAIEYNGEIIHRQLWEHTTIQDGDRLEIVTIVGGG